MLKLKYIGSDNEYIVAFERISTHVVQILGELPFKDNGFTVSRIGKNDNWNYPQYTTLYRMVKGGYQISDDGSIYAESSKSEPVQDPEPHIQTLEDAQEAKIIEMNAIHKNTIQDGIEVTLADGTAEHFDLNEKEQTQLAVLQLRIAAGDNQIPWHTSDETEHCKYYSNEDMALIATAALEYVTYHETYLRDLRIYIRSLTSKTEVEAVTYGIEIPEQYRSQPLRDMLASVS